MYGPDIQSKISQEHNAQMCADLLDMVGPIVDVSPPRYEDEWTIYRLTATKDEIILRLIWDDDGRIAWLDSSSDPSAKCKDSLARHGPPPRPTAPTLRADFCGHVPRRLSR